MFICINHGFFFHRCPLCIVASCATFDGLAISWQDHFALPRVFITSTFPMYIYIFWCSYVRYVKNRLRKRRPETPKVPWAYAHGMRLALAAFSRFCRSFGEEYHKSSLCEYTQDVLRAPRDHTWHLMALRSTFCSFFWQNKTFPLQRCAPSSWENHSPPIVLDMGFDSPL